MKRRKLLTARLLAALVLLATALLHGAPFLPAFGRAFLLIPAVVCLAMFEGPVPSLLFALISGAAWDAVSVGRDGVYTLLCGVLAVAACLFVRFRLRRKLTAALLLNAAALVITLAVYCFAADGGGGDIALTALYIGVPAALVALAFSAVYYLLYKKIYAPADAPADLRFIRKVPVKK